MKDEEKSVEKALDDIFGSDFLEIDVNNNQGDELNSDKKIDDIINNEFDNLFDKKEENNTVNEKKETEVTSNNSIKETRKKFSFKVNNIYIMPIIIISIIIIPTIIYLYINMQKKEVCTYTAIDTGYKIKDKYEITYKKDELIYIESTYKYKALTDEFKKQVKYVKEEKLPVIVNSNGIPGFTYVYEISDNEFIVSGYLDFEVIKFDLIKDYDFKTKPISYIKFNSKTTYKSLKKVLEKNGYVCKKS